MAAQILNRVKPSDIELKDNAGGTTIASLETMLMKINASPEDVAYFQQAIQMEDRPEEFMAKLEDVVEEYAKNAEFGNYPEDLYENDGNSQPNLQQIIDEHGIEALKKKFEHIKRMLNKVPLIFVPTGTQVNFEDFTNNGNVYVSWMDTRNFEERGADHSPKDLVLDIETIRQG